MASGRVFEQCGGRGFPSWWARNTEHLLKWSMFDSVEIRSSALSFEQLPQHMVQEQLHLNKVTARQ